MSRLFRYLRQRPVVLFRIAAVVIGVVMLVVLEPWDSALGAAIFTGAFCAVAILADFLDRRNPRAPRPGPRGRPR